MHAIRFRQIFGRAGLATVLGLGLMAGFGAPASAYAADANAAVAAAVANPDRPQKDRDLDEKRKPADVLTFFGFHPGQTIMDINAGGGYYTEILSYLLGDEGKVYSQNDELYAAFVRDQADSRYQDRLPNVERLVGELPDLKLKPGILDGAMMVLAYHDWYYRPDQRPEPVDIPAHLAAIKKLLKPGAIIGIVDHVATAGSDPNETGNTLHRIDPAVVRAQMEAAGFKFLRESDALRHPEDDHTLKVFDPKVRRMTDRFIHVYQKPE